jgi:hypothetical protein
LLKPTPWEIEVYRHKGHTYAEMTRENPLHGNRTEVVRVGPKFKYVGNESIDLGASISWSNVTGVSVEDMLGLIAAWDAANSKG